MNTLLIIIAVTGRFSEAPMYGINHPTEAACMAAADKFRKDRGFLNNQKAVCVPLFREADLSKTI